jgi:hypothetical protein
VLEDPGVIEHRAGSPYVVRWLRYDSLGRPVMKVKPIASVGSHEPYTPPNLITGDGTRVVRPGSPASALGSRYTNRWYVRTQVLDSLDRVVSGTTGATVPELLGPDGTTQTVFAYTKRGALASIGGSYVLAAELMS